ncbi:MAG: ABC transporter ATP-binding protein [Planctomycetes bacterium]|nr:ABC transporter ATP-binding protein [Planctomycetota bacterium]
MQHQRGDLATIKRILRQGWPHRWMILVTILATAGSGALFGSIILQIEPLLKLLGQADLARAAPDPTSIAGDMRDLGLRLMLIAPAAAACAYCAWWSGQWVANRSMQRFRNRVLVHITKLDLGFHSELKRGDMLTRLTTDLDRMLSLQQTVYGRLLQRPVEAAAWMTVLYIYNWRMAVITTLILMIAGAIITPVLRRTRARSQRARETQAENLSVLEQITAGIRVIKAMGSSTREQDRYAAANQGLFNDNMRVARARAQSDALTYGSVFGLAGATMLAGAFFFSRGIIDPASLVTCLLVMARLISVMREIQRSWGDAQEQIPAVERVFTMLDRPSTIQDRPGARPCPAPQRALTIEQVSFRYAAGSDDVLRKLDLEIPVGKTVALVGESGSGKSTLLDLIPRFHDVTGGRIAIDGVDIREYQYESLVHNVAIVQQDSFLFNDSIYNNIHYGRPDASRAEVETAAKRAHVHEAILGLEGGHGYETDVGDRGGRLSGGQRQRIAIARALLRDAPILLLDEPTSALDADSERHVQEALQELMRGRTTVVVAHRLATIQHADRIYVLAGKDHPLRGTVLESGTHLELVARDGEYARLVRLQQLKT